MLRKLSLLSILVFAVVVSTGCGNPFQSLADDIESSTDTTSSGSSEDKIANVALSFADDTEKPSEPGVGEGFAASRGEYAILVGSMMSFNSYKGTPEAQEFPQFSGLIFHPEIRSGLTITIAENDESGTSIYYAFDDETSWYATAGSVEIVSTRPLKLNFSGVVMKPFGNSIGEFTINGTGTWER